MNQQPTQSAREWKWGLFAALAMMLLALWPQINMWIARGQNWRGLTSPCRGDEVAYSAYLNALIDGGHGKTIHTGRDDSHQQAFAGSLFSIQFIPAYAIALPARLLGLTTSTIFIVLIAFSAFSATLAIFWLLLTVTNNSKLAACGHYWCFALA